MAASDDDNASCDVVPKELKLSDESSSRVNIIAMSSFATAFLLTLSPSSPSILFILRARRRDFVVLAKEGSGGDVQARYRTTEQVRPWLGVDALKQGHACDKSGYAENVEVYCRELRVMLAQSGEVCAESHRAISNWREHSARVCGVSFGRCCRLD